MEPAIIELPHMLGSSKLTACFYCHRFAAAESRYGAYILNLRSCIIALLQHRRLLFKVAKL